MDLPTDHNAISMSQLSPEEYTRRTVTVDFLYLDLESCERCLGTKAALESALERVAPILDTLDVAITARSIHVSTLEAAEATQLGVSPTIRLDGDDIQPDYLENTCESCGELCGCTGDVECRLWRYRGKDHTTAPVGFLVETLLQAITPTQMDIEDGGVSQASQLSSTVRDFFVGTSEENASCDCECS